MPSRIAILFVLLCPALAAANPPVASYIFPAGGQRGAKANVRVGGLFLHNKCGFEMLGVGVNAPTHLTSTKTLWFEGPMLPLPDSQRQEDYPKDMAGVVSIAADAPVGVRYWRLWTSQGATPSMKFVVGDLPEIVEEELDGDPVPVKVTLPVTINGRIFPREDIDIWSFAAKKGETVRCEVNAARLGSPLDARLEICDTQGRRLAEAVAPTGGDPVITFTAPADGEYQVSIHDINMQGGQAYIYRLTITKTPHIERYFPLGGQRGKSLALDLFGRGVPAYQQVTIPRDAPAEYPLTINEDGIRANTILLDADDHPELIAPRDLRRDIVPPAILNGTIASAGQIDEWKWQGKKGESWEFELRAARFGSKLDGVLTISDKDGKVLAKVEGSPGDPVARYQVPADGEYRVQVQDRFRSRGGPEFAYRLRITSPPPPGFRLTLASDPRQPGAADAVTLPRKGQAKLKLNVERTGGFKEPINLDVKGLPAHVTVTPNVIQPNQANVELTFKADEKAAIAVARLTIIGKTADRQVFASLPIGRGVPEQSSVLLAVALPTPFVIKGEYDMGFAARGGMHKHKYKIERNGYDGPIEISLADRQARHLQGVEGPMIVVPAGVSEFTYSAYLPPWMETGRTCRVCVQGVGVIKEPDGSEHRVSFSSVNQNEQLVAVVGPGKLAMEIDRTSYTAVPGKSFAIDVKIKRGDGVGGAVDIELVTPPHARGLGAAKATIAAKAESGQIVVACADALAGPFNMPFIVRATLRHNGEPIVAEVRIEVQP